jgi:hypothetical protein
LLARRRSTPPYQPRCGPKPAARWPERSLRPLILFTESLNIGFALWVKDILVALLPSSLKFRRCDVPVRSAFLADSPQVLAEFFHRGASEKPVAIVDLVNDEAWLQHNHVRDHGIVDGIGVFGDVGRGLGLNLRIVESKSGYFINDFN